MTSRAITLAFLVVLFSQDCLAAEPEAAKAAGARVVSVNGTAQVKEKYLQAGEYVQTGEFIKTASESGVKLLMPDKSIIDIGPKSEFKVESATSEGTEGQLEFGSVRASIQKKLEGKTKFRVRTKSSVLSARGTEFVIDSKPKPGAKSVFVDQVTVKSGVVEMQAPGVSALMLNAGKQVTALAKFTAQGIQIDQRSFKPVEIPQDALQKTMSGATVKDDTFRQVVVVPTSDRQPGSEGPKTAKAAHFGQDAIAGAQIKAARDPEGQKLMPPPPSFRDGMLPPRPGPPLNGLNIVGGSAIETKLNDGVNVTVVFQL